jgi:hypothetical protein
MRLPALLLLALLAFAPPAQGQEAPRVALRVGTHPNLGRLVFDWPTRVAYSVDEADGRVVIRFGAPARIDLAASRRATRNVLGVEQDGDAIAVRIAPGTRPRHFRLGNRIVLDVRDPAPGSATPPPPPPARAPPDAEPRPVRGAPATILPPTPIAPPVGPPPAASVAQAARPVPPPTRAATPAPTATGRSPPVAGRATPQAAPATAGTPIRLLRNAPAIALDAGAGAGLAVFRRGEWIHIVLDRVIDADLSALQGHAIFGGLEAQSAGDATVFRMRWPGPGRLAPRRDGQSWVLQAMQDAAPVDVPPLRVVADAGPPTRLLLEGGRAGGAVTIADPATGETLLVGTLREPGPAVRVARRLPEFDLLPTMLGAAILARSDRLALRAATEDRFALHAAAGESLGLGAMTGNEPPPAAVAMSRLLDPPSGPVPMLLERLRNVLMAVNAAPPLSRGPVRRDAAETLLALGMPQEAQAMAAIAFQEDPQSREDVRLILAHGAAALLAGRAADARLLDDARLPLLDEVVFWRALRATIRGEPAGPALRASAPVVLTYPEALRARTLPLAVEALAQGGETAGAAALLTVAGAEEPGLGLARAMVLEAQGRQDDAIAAYDVLVTGRDRRQRAMAVRRLAELRLAAGSIDRPAAAEALEQSLYAWRGGPEELALRRRIATLRLEGGQGQQAFALLHETGRLFPDQATSLRPALQDAFAAALETAPPLAAATLFDTHTEMLPAGERGQAAVLVLADRLAGLDLPDRATTLLRRAIGTAQDPAARAAIGARLAAMRAAEGDSAGAIAALDASESSGLHDDLAAQRIVLRARALARTGARTEAEALLATLGPPGAVVRAELRAEAQDWPGAAAAMAEHLVATLPAAPAPLEPEHRVSLARSAAYHALAGDEAGLAALREAHGARMEGGTLAEAFGVLTSDPLRGISDLPRLQRELGMMRLLPTRLEALRAGVQVAR